MDINGCIEYTYDKATVRPEKKDILSERLKAFTEYQLLYGYSARAAAIAVGAEPINAPTYGMRWNRFPCVIRYKEELLDSTITQGSEFLLRAVRNLDSISISKDASKGVRVTASSKIVDLYKDKIKEAISTDIVDMVLQSLSDRLKNPVAQVTEADVDAYNEDDSDCTDGCGSSDDDL